ncbi:ribonuclease HII [Peptoniphilus equinus]|uniref:Ribonuclease HII n=1 Tax=Peptoniphilus equinus TaxID=3016343 RepID=A0ABY7QSF0_9FIRM|nr:ribonuclease HII [Peptoniphilus equinus]WBW49714.1 ribonuclease HII [Peptoniphilus equinus]
MENFESQYKALGYSHIVGIDEVGRGCLFGDVVACAVIMPESRIEGVKDSKKLSQKKREELYTLILKHAVAVGIGRADAQEIDSVNIKNATHLAMERAVNNLRDQKNRKVYTDLLLIDAETINLKVAQVPLIHGDDRCYSIACASIVAKVYRDSLCQQWDERYPGYSIAANKGYGTAIHRRALQSKGPSAMHRRSFLGKILEPKG